MFASLLYMYMQLTVLKQVKLNAESVKYHYSNVYTFQ